MATAESVQIRCSWKQTAGKELQDLVPTRLFDEDIFVKPDIDEVVNEERAVLFSNAENPDTPCELEYHISRRFKIAALSLVCSVPKVELFLGTSQEYYETIYGTIMEADDTDMPIFPYRYDIEIDRSGIADISLKLLTSSNEICIFGSMLHIAPNPNGITTQMEKLQEILKDNIARISAEKSDENAQRVHQLMTLTQSCNNTSTTDTTIQPDMSNICAHIDAKFEQFERTITKRLEDFESQQMQKLNEIIEILKLHK